MKAHSDHSMAFRLRTRSCRSLPGVFADPRRPLRSRSRRSSMTSRSAFKPLLPMVALAAVLAAPSAYAQAVYGSIAGTITDSTGAAMPGVSVTVTSVERQTTDTVTTNPAGLYVKERLLPGTYTVKAELSGFRPATVTAVRVSVDTQTGVDLGLEVGQMSEAVEVSAQGALLKTDRADVATTFETE